MLKNAGPELNLESDKMGHLIFQHLSSSAPYHHFRNFQNFRNNNRWRYWKSAENGLSCQYGKLKSSESDPPMKIRSPILSDSKFSSGPAFLSI